MPPLSFLIVLACFGAIFELHTPLSNGIHVHAQSTPFFYKGHDLSSLKILEDGGAVYHDTALQNATRAAEDILSDGGMNTVRLRLWVNPPRGQYDLPYVLALAKRFSDKGLRIYLDYHFSDTWADPGHQTTPAAWPSSLDALATTLRSYVNSTLTSFSQAGVPLSLVSLGNEIRSGMLWPSGRVNGGGKASNFTSLATLYASARQGVRAAVQAARLPVEQQPQVMIHIDNGWDTSLQVNWFSSLVGTGKVNTSDWDVFGFSMYPFYGTGATLSSLQKTLSTLAAQYKKPIHVVETDWPESCDGSKAPKLSEPSIPAGITGQTKWVQEIIKVVKAVPDGLGQGVHYWEPAWLNNTGLGSACQDALLFSTDWSQRGKMLAYSRSSVNMFQ